MWPHQVSLISKASNNPIMMHFLTSEKSFPPSFLDCGFLLLNIAMALSLNNKCIYSKGLDMLYHKLNLAWILLRQNWPNLSSLHPLHSWPNLPLTLLLIPGNRVYGGPKTVIPPSAGDGVYAWEFVITEEKVVLGAQWHSLPAEKRLQISKWVECWLNSKGRLQGFPQNKPQSNRFKNCLLLSSAHQVKGTQSSFSPLLTWDLKSDHICVLILHNLIVSQFTMLKSVAL